MRSARDFHACLARVGGLSHTVARVLKRETQHSPQTVFVFYQEDVRHR